MGSEGGDAASRETLGEDLRSGLEEAAAAAAATADGVRSIRTISGRRKVLDSCGDRRMRDGDELSALL